MSFLGMLKNTTNVKETYGFKSRKCPPAIKELKEFEKDMWSLVNNIEFKPIHNSFQNKMKDDLREINSSGKVIVSADKSTNLYKMNKDEYNKHLVDNISSAYKKTKSEKTQQINKGAYKISKDLDLDDRMKKLQESESYITIKDHKPNFPARPTFRLINPSKTDLGRVSKQLLDRINKDLQAEMKVNQWKNTNSVIKWFKKIENKESCRFLQFDIESFYPSITKELFRNAIDHAKKHVRITSKEIDIILQSRRTLLFHLQKPWAKRDNDNDFDVPMGSFDGAEVCELIGTYILSTIIEEKICDISDIGLYRDDGLAVFRKESGPQMERKTKKIIQKFKENKLNITTEPTTTVVQYLDVEFDLRNDIYRPYRKPNSEPLYVNINSNHPPSVLKQIPQGIAKRLSTISSNEEVFKSAVSEYEKALKDSGFEEKLAYTPDDTPEQIAEKKKKKGRKRKIIWYNPPYSKNIKTNIGKEFLRIIRRNFPTRNKLHKIFNKNSIKISYCCTKNISAKISTHNKSLMMKTDDDESNTEQDRLCNCRRKEECPMSNQCLKSNIVYRAKVTSEDTTKEYIGCTATTFKDRYTTHKLGFNHIKYAKGCELTKYIQQLKSEEKQYRIQWDILDHVRGKYVREQCRLCTTETMRINEHLRKSQLLNKGSVNKCPHFRGMYLDSISKL